MLFSEAIVIDFLVLLIGTLDILIDRKVMWPLSTNNEQKEQGNVLPASNGASHSRLFDLFYMGR